MDPLVLAAGTAVVSAMATDGWQQARSAIVRFWRRIHAEHASTIEDKLAETRSQVLAARQAGDREAERALAAEWQQELQRLLATDKDLKSELWRVLHDELTPLLPPPEQAAIGAIVMTGKASGQGRVYQAGHNMIINEQRP